MTTKKLSRSLERLFYLLLVMGAVSTVSATGPTTTTIADVVYRADGQPAAGTIVVSWPAFNTADHKPVAAGALSVPIGAEGAVTFALVPNEGGDPGGTFYKAIYKLSDGTTFTEYWVVPSSSPTTIAAIRASVVPRQVGAQFVNRQYVDTAVATTNEQVVHKAGSEAIAGVKSFAASPEVPTPASGIAAVNKDYVTGAIGALSDGFVDKGGDTMTGPLTIPGAPAAPGHAANRQYVDLQVADVAAGLPLKLGRMNDTPISLASVRYASQFVTIQAAIDDLPSTGGVVIIPNGTYTVSTCIDSGTKPLILQGQGWWGSGGGVFGDPAWQTTAVKGTILRVTGTNDAICVTAQYLGKLIVRDLAIVGPGTGTSTGINFNPSGYTTDNKLNNVFVANFYKGINFTNTDDSQFTQLYAYGNATGINSLGASGCIECKFYYLSLQGNTNAAIFGSANDIRIYGGLVQTNTNGILVGGASGVGVSNYTSEGIWFENNTNYGEKFDSTVAGISGISLRSNRSSSAILFAGANTFGRVSFENVEAGGASLTIPASASGCVLNNSTFASVTHTGNCVVIAGSQINGIGLPTNTPLVGNTGGVGMISANGSNDIQLGRYGSAPANNLSAWGVSFNYGKEDFSATRFRVDSATAGVWNGLNFKVFSDAGTTAKFTVLGASGNVSSNGKANFNGGVCQDTAQTICDTSATGAPSGMCVTGSTYKRSDGGSASTLYVCESTAWVAVGGAASVTWSSITNPAGSQALSMGANPTTWTWNAATGAGGDLVKMIDTASNTGTGHILSVETATSSNVKPFQVKARGTTSFEVNEFGTVSTLAGVTTSAGLTMQVGGAVILKGRDDWTAAVTINGADATTSGGAASAATLRGGDSTFASGSSTGGALLIRSGGVTSGSGTPGNLQVAQAYLKDTTVTSGYLQCFKAAAAMTVGDCGNSAINSVGVALSAGSTNPVVVQFQGIATLQFDATASPSAGWFACSSASAGGKVIVQSAACAAGRQVGIVAQNGTSITSGKVFLQTR